MKEGLRPYFADSHGSYRITLPEYYKEAWSYLACGPTKSCTGAETGPPCFAQREHSIKACCVKVMNDPTFILPFALIMLGSGGYWLKDFILYQAPFFANFLLAET